MPVKRDYFPAFKSRQELRHALNAADPSIFSAAMQFLEDDPRTMGSGYVKELIWKRIQRYSLSPADIARLEHAALRYLQRPMSREFRCMCLTMCRIATQDFWEKVKSNLYSPNPKTRLNARCLYAYAAGIETGERQRLEMKQYIRRYYASESQGFLKLDERLLAAVYAPNNWKHRGIVHRAVNPDDLPILYYNTTEEDLKYATLDMRACDHERMLSALQAILSTGTMDVFTATPWLYAIYLLQQMDDPKAVPILTEFLKTKIEYKFEGVTKDLLEHSVIKVVKHYATSEAEEVIKQYRQADQEWTEWSRGINVSVGWVLSYP